MSTLIKKPETALREFLNPFDFMRREFDDVLGRFWPEGEFAISRGAMPMMDVAETDSAVEVKMDLPGLKAEEIKVDVRGSDLLVSGERKEEKEDKGRNYHRSERRWGKFSRAVTLPCEVASDRVEATYQNGVLELKLPKKEPCKTQTVRVKAM